MLTRRVLNRALLARQLLLDRSATDPLTAIGRVAGLQAQSPNPPYFGLWSRLDQFARADLTELIETRQVVRVALMHGTAQLVAARDAPGLRHVVQPALHDALLATHGERLRGVSLTEVARVTRELLEDIPRTIADLGAELAARWPDVPVTSLTAAARTEVALVPVPPGGTWGAVGQPAWTTLSTWLNHPNPSTSTVADLVEWYLSAYGPATLDDIRAWSGLPGLSEIVEDVNLRLVRLRGEEGAELFDIPDARLPDEDEPAPARYLAEFDNALQAHDDRARIMYDDDRKAIFATPGVVPGVVLVDGFTQGTWKITRSGQSAYLVVRPFAQIPTRDVHELTEEGLRLLAFAVPEASTHDVRFNSR